MRNNCKEDAIPTYIHKSFELKIRINVSINGKDIESVSVELLYEKRSNTLFNMVYRPPNEKAIFIGPF